MAKAKKKKEVDKADIFAKIAADTGGDVIGNLDPIRFFIDTGNLAFNYTCSGKFIGGGIPSGRITEMYGASSSGKSLFAANILHGCQMMDGWTILLDCENAANNEFMERVSGIDSKRLLRHTPPTLEKVFRTVHTVTKQIRDAEEANGLERKPITFVYDSITVSPCERELKENDLPMDHTDADWKRVVGRKEQPGERAKICGAELRKITPLLEKQDVTLVILNQVREKIGVMYGSPETTGGGGKALEFYASLRLRLAAKKKIENKALDIFSGINMSVKNVKNRTFRPFVVSDDIKLYFDNGIDPLSGVLSCLRQDGRIILSGQGNYKVADEYLPDNQTEYKFRAKKVDNTVKPEVLYDCPRLVDCETTEEVKEYLSHFTTGMAASASGDFEETDLSFDMDGNPVTA